MGLYEMSKFDLRKETIIKKIAKNNKRKYKNIYIVDTRVEE